MTFRIGRLTLEMSYPLVAVMTAVIITDKSLSVIACFTAAVMHELGHIAVLCRCGSAPERVKLTLFDIAIVDRKKYSRSIKQELCVILAGVTVNFILAALFYQLYLLFHNEFLMMLCTANLGLGIFNSLPVDNLDGGQALGILLGQYYSELTASRIIDIISLFILIPTACIGFLLLLQSRYNFTLLLTALYLVALILLKRIPRTHKNNG
ncbi:MAG: hypothetical protein II711_02325 [Clostridia bacterium]|nr:hypothetical protein [Clostridia bacterium]